MNRRDTPARLLNAAVRRLPREWADAMRAELAALTDPAERRRFATGCVIAALRWPSTAFALGRGLVTVAVGVVAVVLAAGIGDDRVRAEVFGLVAVVALAAGLLSRWLRVAPGRGATLARTGGGLLVALELLNALYRWERWPRTDLDGERVTAFVSAPVELALVLAYLAAILVLTSRRLAVGRRALIMACGAGGAGALASFLPALTNTAVPRSAGGMVLLVYAATVVTVVGAARATGRLRTAMVAGLSAGAIAALGIAVFDTGLYELFPHWAPHIVDRVIPRGTPAAAITEANELDAQDPFIAVYFVGLLCALGALLAGGRSSRPSADEIHGDLERTA